MKRKIVKIKIGSVFIDGQNHDVYQDAWERTSKKGQKYFELRIPMFMKEIEVPEDKDTETQEVKEEVY